MKKTTPKAKYLSIAEKIAKDIKSGKYKVGERVPSEREIGETENVSSITSRRVLLELESHGLVKRIKGRGTVVLKTAQSPLVRVLGSYSAMQGSFATGLKKEGIEYTFRILEESFQKGRVSIEIANQLYEIVGKFFKLRILRYGNGMLFKDETIYIDATLCPDIDKCENYDSIFEEICMRQKIASVNRNIYAKVVVEKDEYFENEAPMALMMLDGVAISQSGSVVQIEKSAYNAETYHFTVEAKS